MIDINITKLEFSDRVLFNNLEYKFKSDSTYIITGKSGSGKTTLLHCILGNYHDFEGKVTISGSTPNESHRKKIGFLLQSHPLVKNEKVIEYCIFNAMICGMPRTEAKELADKYLELFQVDHLKTRKIKKLSGGEKQRVALCGELCKDPDILLLDEPTGSLDGNNTQIVYNAIKKITGKLIIIVTHGQVDDDLGQKLEIRNGQIAIL